MPGLANNWMKKCDEGHESCKKSDELRLPSRVVDVGIDPESETVHLKETAETDRDPYLSLSQCWGLEQIIAITTATLKERKAGIKLSELSETFRHAVKVTRRLGIRYLWIDSLCNLHFSVEHGSFKKDFFCSYLTFPRPRADLRMWVWTGQLSRGRSRWTFVPSEIGPAEDDLHIHQFVNYNRVADSQYLAGACRRIMFFEAHEAD